MSVKRSKIALRHTDLRSWKKNRITRVIRHPLFPVTFLVRNISTIRGEGILKNLPARLERRRLIELVLERAKFFWEMISYLQKLGFVRYNFSKAYNQTVDYCDRCGRCCEVASGFPEFPKSSKMPLRWQKIFSEGLGRDHRFCPFLLENRRRSVSLCAVYEWRPLPCRIFGRQECEALKEDLKSRGTERRQTHLSFSRVLGRLLRS